MEGAGLQPGQLKLAQPFGDRPFGDRDRETAGYFVTQIDAAPTDNLVLLGIGPFDRQRLQLHHLRRGQIGPTSADPDRAKPRYPQGVVAIHPVPQGLPVHSRLLSRRFP